MKKIIAVIVMVFLALLLQISAMADNLPIIKDEAELLTEEEEELLYQEMLPICQYGIPVMWTTYEDGNYQSTIPDFYERQSLDQENWTAFMINMKTRMIAIYSKGELWKYITADVANEITDSVYRLATAGNYYDCANAAFAQMINVLKSKTGKVESSNNAQAIIDITESSFFSTSLSEVSYDDLLEMRAQINSEILMRFNKIEGVLIEPGLYIVGEDIPEGNYYFEGVEGRFTTSIHVYPSIDKMGTLDAIQSVSNIGYSEYDFTSPKSGKFILKNGNTVKFVQGPAIIHVYQGLMN